MRGNFHIHDWILAIILVIAYHFNPLSAHVFGFTIRAEGGGVLENLRHVNDVQLIRPNGTSIRGSALLFRDLQAAI